MLTSADLTGDLLTLGKVQPTKKTLSCLISADIELYFLRAMNFWTQLFWAKKVLDLILFLKKIFVWSKNPRKSRLITVNPGLVIIKTKAK